MAELSGNHRLVLTKLRLVVRQQEAAYLARTKQVSRLLIGRLLSSRRLLRPLGGPVGLLPAPEAPPRPARPGRDTESPGEPPARRPVGCPQPLRSADRGGPSLTHRGVALIAG
jgi:hypothetical protein